MVAKSDIVSAIENQVQTFLDVELPHAAPSVVVALSGGLDSIVLLRVLMVAVLKRGAQLRAVHVNHGLSPNAYDWEVFCEKTCQKWSIPFKAERLCLQRQSGDSLEAVAREARYEVFAKELQLNEFLFLAHHADDQAETVLLQLFRGAGPEGLSAMSSKMAWGKGSLCRPLLPFSRVQLQQYADTQQLSWIEDESNDDTRFDRNYLRQNIMPLLKARWPGVLKTLARSAQHCQTMMSWMNQDIKNTLNTMIDSQGHLSVTALREQHAERQAWLLRVWLQRFSCTLPSERQLKQGLKNLLCMRNDSKAMMNWGDYVIGRFRDQLHFLPKEAINMSSVKIYEWHFEQVSMLVHDFGKLHCERQLGRGLKSSIGSVEVRFRQNGEKICLNPDIGRQRLKILFQTWSIPHWKRDSIPLLYHAGELIAIVGYGIAHGYEAASHEEGWVIETAI